MENKKTELKWWNVDCVLTQHFTIGIDGTDAQSAKDALDLEYKNGNIDMEKEVVNDETFDIKAATPMLDLLRLGDQD